MHYLFDPQNIYLNVGRISESPNGHLLVLKTSSPISSFGISWPILGLPTFFKRSLWLTIVIVPQVSITLFMLSYSRNSSRHPQSTTIAVFHSSVTDAICLLYVSSNCSIISGFLYLRVVCTWHSFMQWSTCTQTSRDTLRESRFHMNMNLIEISLGQSSQPYLLLWSSLLMVKWYVNYASSFAHFSS